VHYVTLEQDLDQSPEGPKASLPTKASPGLIINLCVYSKLLNLSLLFYVHLRSGVE
jgi:hypothetical protein